MFVVDFSTGLGADKKKLRIIVILEDWITEDSL